MIVDIRNDRSQSVVFALGSLLVDKPAPFARFTVGDLSNPGAFGWTDSLPLPPAPPHYPGKVVVLVDEVRRARRSTPPWRSGPRRARR